MAVSGYTADVVANGTNLPVSSTISADFDAAGYSLMERGYSNNAGGVATQGLPSNGIINSTLTAGLPFQLASYSASNSLRLLGSASGTLTLAQPRAINTLYVLAATGSGSSNMSVTLRYTDNTTELFGGNFVPDWFGGGNYAILGLGRTTPSGGIENNGSDPRLYQFAFTLSTAGRAKQLASVDFTNAGGGVLNVMGLSAESTGDLVISTAGQLVFVGNYNNITVTGTGQGTLTGPVQAQGAVQVQSGGILVTNCQALTGAATFTLAAGGTLMVCDPAGISASGATGAVQTAGVRSFSNDASYVYNGSAAQVTGTGLPAQTRNLTASNPVGLILNQATAVRQLLRLTTAGNLATGGNVLTLLSDATGTALVANEGAGVVTGNATVQRYIDPTNAGLGYRHYAAPVANTTVADLATAGFAPEVSQGAAYNASATPGTVTPFPTVFGYDQSRVALTNALTSFDRGFAVPASLSTPLAVGRGYAVNLAGTQLVDFVGTLNTGPQTLTLARNATGSANAAEAGWHLVGNPYPAPIDYALVTPGNTNLENAMYVYESAGPYAGSYRPYVNGIPLANRYVGTAQGFFVRVSSGQTSGTLAFQNSQRVTEFATQVPFRRGAADVRPLVQLELRGAAGPADALYAYAQTGATPAYDDAFDARKLPNTTGLNLSSMATTGENLSIDGRPAFVAATVLPLAVGVPAAGTYTLTTAALTNLPAGLDALLSDALTGQTVNLSRQPVYAFTVTAAQAATMISGRFVLHFAASSPLATVPALTAADITLYPNPARDQFTVLMPAIAGTALVQGTLLNALGQVVRQLSAPATAAGARLGFDTAGLPAGVYILRLRAGNATLAKRVVLQ